MRAFLLLLAYLVTFGSANIFRDAWSLRRGLYGQDSNKGEDSLGIGNKEFISKQPGGFQQQPVQDVSDDDSGMFLKMSNLQEMNNKKKLSEGTASYEFNSNAKPPGRISGSAYSSAVSSKLSGDMLIKGHRPRWLNDLPRVNFRMDPVINFKLKQKINQFGACIQLGMDYMSDMKQWRTYCAVEDSFFRGRFSLRGSELGWTKSWLWNLGMGEESSAKFKLRVGFNLNSKKVYARLRFRCEPMNPFDIGEGLSCAGKIPLPGVLPILRVIPLRVEYRVRINTPVPDFKWKSEPKTNTVSLSTGIDRIDLSLDELNFCLEWDEESPLWGIGVQSAKKMIPSATKTPSLPTKSAPRRSNNGPAPAPRTATPQQPQPQRGPKRPFAGSRGAPPGRSQSIPPSVNKAPAQQQVGVPTRREAGNGSPSPNRKRGIRRFVPYDYFPV